MRRSMSPAVLLVALTLTVPLACSSDDAATTSTTARPRASSSSSPPTTEGPTTTGPPATAPDSAPVGVNPLPPVGAGRPVSLGGGMSVVMTGTKDVEVTARGPGETSGPAVAVTIQVRNEGREPVALDGFAVNATSGDSAPAESASGVPSDPLRGTVAAGGRSNGVYVFRVPKAGASLLVEVQSNSSPDVARFRA